MDTKKFTMMELFQAGRRAGTPIFAISSFDYEATIQQIVSWNAKKAADKQEPIIQWDSMRGWMGRNELGKKAIEEALSGEPIESTIGPIGQLEFAVKLPEDTMLFMMNAQHYFDRDGQPAAPKFVQAVWNLRDIFKSNGRSLILLGPSFTIPAELQQDVLRLDEELPDDEQLDVIIRAAAADAGVDLPEDSIPLAIDALRGIAAFPAEQAAAMSITKKHGLNVAQLWERKRQLINETPALTVWLNGEKFNDLGGLAEIKSRFRRIIAGKRRPRVVVWLDEIEKQMAGVGTDTSGTSTDQLGVLLNEMVEKDYTGTIFVGVPGAAKSAMAKAIGNEAEVLTIKLDLGDAKGQFVGQSEEKIRRAMKIIEAVGGHGGAFFVATSNDISAIKPELKRRFKKGIWFFDLPDSEERTAIWNIFLDKYPDVDPNDLMNVDDSNWTGDEIRTCVTTAWEEEVSLSEAARSIIPVAISGREQVERLRREANGKYNSTGAPGAYTLIGDADPTQNAANSGRKLKLDD